MPLVLTPQPEGGYLVTSPSLPELVTEGDSLDQAIEHAQDAARAAVEICEDLGRPLPEPFWRAGPGDWPSEFGQSC